MAKSKTKKSVWNPEYKYETLTGKFMDYRGIERDFTMVAVSVPMEDECAVVTRPVEYIDEYEIPEKNVLNEKTGEIECVPAEVKEFVNVYDEVLAPVAKMLSVGVSVRCVRDDDKNLGVRIAYGKAVKLLNHTVFVSHGGMINTKMVQALLEQESEHFKKDPGSYLAGYNTDKQKFEATGRIAEAEKTADEIDVNVQKNVPTDLCKPKSAIVNKLRPKSNDDLNHNINKDIKTKLMQEATENE